MTPRDHCPEVPFWPRHRADAPEDPALAAHLEVCPRCRREHQLAALFGELAAVEAPRLPEPATLRWRAQILADLERRETEARRRARPALWTAAIALSTVAAGIAAMSWSLLLPAVAGGSAIVAGAASLSALVGLIVAPGLAVLGVGWATAGR